MVTRVQTILTDDLDDLPADETVDFAFDGKAYKIDLSREHATEFRTVLKHYAKAGRLAAADPTKRRRRRRASAPPAVVLAEAVAPAEPEPEVVKTRTRRKAS